MEIYTLIFISFLSIESTDHFEQPRTSVIHCDFCIYLDITTSRFLKAYLMTILTLNWLPLLPGGYLLLGSSRNLRLSHCSMLI